MSKKVYLLSFDPQSLSAPLLHQVITSSPFIEDWWHYLLSTYLLVTSYSGPIIQRDIKARWGEKEAFLLIEVNTKDSTGILPKEAWDWINTRP